MRNPLILLAVLAIAMASAQASPSEQAQDQAALRELKEVLWPKAYSEQDTKLLGRILADEFQMIDGAGDWSTKAEELAWIAKNKPPYDSLTFSIRRLDIFENGTAIVAGTGTIRGSDAEGAYVAKYQSTNILIKRDGVWKAVASHVSGYKRESAA